MEKLALLAVYAHPDDEAYGSAGTLARYAREGVVVSLLSATRGEAGEISDAALARGVDLGAVREAELRDACAIMDVHNLRFLDCPDGAVAQCDSVAVVAKIVAAIREWRPQVVITFGPEGIYGHPDHVAVHQLTLAAVDLAGDPSAYQGQAAAGLEAYKPKKVYFRVLPRQLIPSLGKLFLEIRANLGLPPVDVDTMFAPDEMVTAAIDIRPFAAVKRQAIAAHRTQTGADAEATEPEDGDDELNYEYYGLRNTRCARFEDRETDLFAGLR